MKIIRESTNESFEIGPEQKKHLVIYPKGDICLNFRLNKGASLKIQYIVTGGTNTTKLFFELEESAKLVLDGAFSLKDEDSLDFEYKTTHLGTNSTSNFNLVGTLDDSATKTSSETIDFKAGAVGASGSESEKVTLFSSSCKNVAKPIILCGEENMHGTHNFSSSHLSLEVVDYLRARGVDIESAKRIISHEQIMRVAKLCKNEAIIEEVKEALH